MLDFTPIRLVVLVAFFVVLVLNLVPISESKHKRLLTTALLVEVFGEAVYIYSAIPRVKVALFFLGVAVFLVIVLRTLKAKKAEYLLLALMLLIAASQIECSVTYQDVNFVILPILTIVSAVTVLGRVVSRKSNRTLFAVILVFSIFVLFSAVLSVEDIPKFVQELSITGSIFQTTFATSLPQTYGKTLGYAFGQLGLVEAVAAVVILLIVGARKAI